MFCTLSANYSPIPTPSKFVSFFCFLLLLLYFLFWSLQVCSTLHCMQVNIPWLTGFPELALLGSACLVIIFLSFSSWTSWSSVWLLKGKKAHLCKYTVVHRHTSNIVCSVNHVKPIKKTTSKWEWTNKEKNNNLQIFLDKAAQFWTVRVLSYNWYSTAEKVNCSGLLDDRMLFAFHNVGVVGEENRMVLLWPLAGGQNASGACLHCLHCAIVHQ